MAPSPPPTDASTVRRGAVREAVRTLAVAGALVLLAALFFALGARDGIVSTNDGSHYALTKALAVDGTARIDPYVNLTAIQPRRGTPTPADYRDVSFYDGHFYSDRPPGTAFLAVPLYWTGLVADAISGRTDVDFPLRYVTMLPPLLGALATLALYGLARGLGAAPWAAALTAAGGALTTPLLKYATLLYSHIGAAACVTGALALLLAAERGRNALALLAGAGAALGWSGVVEYPNLPLIVPAGLYLLWRARREGRGWAAPLAFAAGWAVPVLLLAGYNWALFDRPWRTSYSYQFYFAWSRSLVTTYVTPPWIGLRWLLLGLGRPQGGHGGLLIGTPALLLALWGLAILWRRGGESRARALLLLGIALAVLLPAAAHRTYWGGGSRDVRYLVAIVPALYAPLALWLGVFLRGRPAFVRAGWALVALAASGWGLARAYLNLFAMFGHPAAERPPRAALGVLLARWREPGVVAPNLWLEPYFLTLTAPLAGGLWLAWAIWRARRQAAPVGAATTMASAD